jgi:hypothetical protein
VTTLLTASLTANTGNDFATIETNMDTILRTVDAVFIEPLTGSGFNQLPLDAPQGLFNHEAFRVEKLAELCQKAANETAAVTANDAADDA